MTAELSGHFGYRRLLGFSGHTVAMVLFTSIYEVIDGFFVSNFVGKDVFSSLNLIYSLIQILASAGVMFGVGGCALVAKTLGEGRKDAANQFFSMIVVAIGVGGCTGILIGFWAFLMLHMRLEQQVASLMIVWCMVKSAFALLYHGRFKWRFKVFLLLQLVRSMVFASCWLPVVLISASTLYL